MPQVSVPAGRGEALDPASKQGFWLQRHVLPALPHAASATPGRGRSPGVTEARPHAGKGQTLHSLRSSAPASCVPGRALPATLRRQEAQVFARGPETCAPHSLSHRTELSGEQARGLLTFPLNCKAFAPGVGPCSVWCGVVWSGVPGPERAAAMGSVSALREGVTPSHHRLHCSAGGFRAKSRFSCCLHSSLPRPPHGLLSRALPPPQTPALCPPCARGGAGDTELMCVLASPKKMTPELRRGRGGSGGGGGTSLGQVGRDQGRPSLAPCPSTPAFLMFSVVVNPHPMIS